MMKAISKNLALTFLVLVVCVLSLTFAQSDEMWRSASAPYEFDAERDAANHSDYRIEQWSYSGNLSAADGHRFGYQMKFIRAGVSYKPENPSRWAVRDLFITQLALTDVDGKQFKTASRINRAGIGWAGASTEALHLWNDDWEIRLDQQSTKLKAIDDEEGNSTAIELSLEQGRPLIVHGDDGVFQKGFLPFNASHFYSQTRMPTSGWLTIDGKRVEVSGQSWMDHEFGTSFLEEGQKGWDVFAIQLDDGMDLMIYQIRLNDGSRDEYSIATLVDANGRQTRLRADQSALQPNARWASPASGGNYPVKWRLTIPEKQIDLELRAMVDDQEFHDAISIGFSYWKGSIDVAGTSSGRPVKGGGFLEMTGYVDGQRLAFGQ